MEVIRHEKAALISVAYFIGALTAFIWYGVSQTIDLPLNVAEQAQTASVISAVNIADPAPVSFTPIETTPQREGIALYYKGVLDVEAIGGTKVLSFNAGLSGFSTSSEFTMQGNHVGDLAYTVSPTEEYVFFCEQKTIDSSTCSPFIYDVLQDKIYPLSTEAGAFDVTNVSARVATWTKQGLSLGGAVSVTSNTPWLMATN